MASQRNRVVIVVQNLPVPFDRRVWLEATTLQRAGYDVTVICPKMKGFNASREQLEGITIRRYSLPFEAKGPFGFVAEFAWCWTRVMLITMQLAARPGFDLLHACNPPETYWLLARLWKLGSKRFLFDHHDLSPEMYEAKFQRQGGLLYRMLLWLEAKSFRTADVVITTNESHKRVAIERGGLDPERVFVVRSGPDLRRFKRYPPDPELKKGKDHLLVFLGEMLEQDGVEGLVDSLRMLRDVFDRSDVHCVFVGGGAHQPAVKKHAEATGVAEMCTFTGVVSDEVLCRILSTADVAVDPVPLNNWSDKSTMNKIVEYMYFGLPIVAFDLAETRHSAGGAAIYAHPNSTESLAMMINELLENPVQRRQMTDIGVNRLEAELAWQHSEPTLLKAYELARLD